MIENDEDGVPVHSRFAADLLARNPVRCLVECYYVQVAQKDNGHIEEHLED